MGWAKLDDGFHDHPKLIGLPLDAVGLYTVCLTWAHRHHAQLGRLPQGVPERFAGTKAKRLAALLVKHGLWDVNGDEWQIHDYEDYLPAAERPATADEVRKARSEAGKRGAKARWQAKEGQADSKLLSESDSKPMPPTRTRPEPTATDVAVTAQTFDDFWDAYPRREAKQTARKAWDKATRTNDPDAIVAGAQRYATDPNRDPAYTKHAATWLNGGCWDDPPLPLRRDRSKPTHDETVRGWGALAMTYNDDQKAIGQ